MAMNTTSLKRPIRKRHPHPTPPYGCTTDGARCAEARRLYVHHGHARAQDDTDGLTLLFRQYRYHLRQASVTAGQTQWKATDHA